MPPPYKFSLASTPGGLAVPLPFNPTAAEPIGKKERGVALDGTPRRSGKEGRLLTWDELRTADWQSIWNQVGGDSADYAIGFIRCYMAGGYGAAEVWGDYRCVIWKPVDDWKWAYVNLRTNVQVKVTEMQLHNLSSVNDPAPP